MEAVYKQNKSGAITQWRATSDHPFYMDQNLLNN